MTVDRQTNETETVVTDTIKKGLTMVVLTLFNGRGSRVGGKSKINTQRLRCFYMAILVDIYIYLLNSKASSFSAKRQFIKASAVGRFVFRFWFCMTPGFSSLIQFQFKFFNSRTYKLKAMFLKFPN